MTFEKDFEPYLQVEDAVVDRDDVAMLRAIDERGSLSGAAEALERSYPRLQQRVVALEEALGPLVERTRGGADGGGSSLTETARSLVGRFDRLEAAYEGVARVDETVLSGPVIDRDGELATVDTAVGPVLAVVPEPAEAASVAIRSDAVSLHAPAEVPVDEGTSVRNRFEGVVSSLESGDAVARVGVALDDEVDLAALVTRRSVAALGLEPGRPIVASVKATAARGVPESGAGDGEDPAGGDRR